MRSLNWDTPVLSRVTKTYETNTKKKDYRASSFILSTSYQQVFLFSLSASDPSPDRKASPKPASPFPPSYSSSFLSENTFFSVVYIQNLYPHKKRFWSNFTLSDQEYVTITMAHVEWHSVLNTSGKKPQTNQPANQKPWKPTTSPPKKPQKTSPTNQAKKSILGKKTDNELIS